MNAKSLLSGATVLRQVVLWVFLCVVSSVCLGRQSDRFSFDKPYNEEDAYNDAQRAQAKAFLFLLQLQKAQEEEAQRLKMQNLQEETQRAIIRKLQEETPRAQAEPATNRNKGGTRELGLKSLPKPILADLVPAPASFTAGQRWTNTMGMVVVKVPGTEVAFSVWDVRVGDYAAYASANTDVDGSWSDLGFAQDETHPVVKVSWDDAQAFCSWLTEKERGEGKIGSRQIYRLPSDAEWSMAVGLAESPNGHPSTKDRKIRAYPWGTQWPPPKEVGNYGAALNVDSYVNTSPVGSFGANSLGLYDMGGNVWQWCEDWYDGEQKSRVVRGASCAYDDPDHLLSSYRGVNGPGDRPQGVGFRCVLGIERADKPAVAGAPASFTAGQRWTNTVGMVFTGVAGVPAFSIWDTRVSDYQAYAKANSGIDQSWKEPGFEQTAGHPVVKVSWADAQAFCAWLTKKERGEGKINATQRYRLPTDAEWSVAVGLEGEVGGTPEDKDAKIKGVYPWGTQWPPPKGVGNYSRDLGVDDYNNTSPVGSFKPNKHGLYDMGGNVWQWCEDWYDGGQTSRVLRGASWGDNNPGCLLSSSRSRGYPGLRYINIGFRCVLVGGGSL